MRDGRDRGREKGKGNLGKSLELAGMGALGKGDQWESRMEGKNWDERGLGIQEKPQKSPGSWGEPRERGSGHVGPLSLEFPDP